MMRDLNLAAARLLRGERDDLVGTSGLMYVPGDFAKRFHGQLDDVLDHGVRRVFCAFFDGVYYAMWLKPLRQAEELALTWFRRAVVSEALEPGDGFEAVTLGAHHLGPLAAMSPRELSVLRLIGLGRTARDIGTLLHRSPRTIESNVITIGRKLGVTTRVEMARAAIHSGISGADEDPESAALLEEGFFSELLASGA